ncbi:MAG TPA: hypothetical protein VGK74_12125 [Symbiobacteriaceae bacterium]
MSAGTTAREPFVLRPLDFGEILDYSFRLYRRSWKLLILLGLLLSLPGIVWTGLSQASLNPGGRGATTGLMFQWLTAPQRGQPLQMGWLLVIGTLVIVLMLLVYPLITGMFIAIISRTYFSQPTTWRDGLRIVKGRYLAILGTGLLSGLAVLLPLGVLVAVAVGLSRGEPLTAAVMMVLFFLLLLALIPVYAAAVTYLAFTGHAIIVEGVGGGFPAIARSVRLVRGRFWPLLGLGIVFSIMGSVLSGIITTVVVLPLTLLQMFVAHSVVLGWAIAILNGLGTAVVMPFTLVGLTVAYYDTRVRKEGLDLELVAIGQTPPAES